MADNAGYLYILSNDAMPGLYKIGFTTRSPDARALELYKQSSGVPFAFRLEFAIMANSVESAERDVFEELAEYRYSKNREFFKIDIEYAIEVVARVAMATHADLAVVPVDEAIDFSEIHCLMDGLERIGIDPVHPMYVKTAMCQITPEEMAPVFVRYMQEFEVKLANLRQ